MEQWYNLSREVMDPLSLETIILRLDVFPKVMGLMQEVLGEIQWPVLYSKLDKMITINFSILKKLCIQWLYKWSIKLKFKLVENWIHIFI